VLLSGWLVSPAPAAAAASTVVTIGFDDGTADQLGALSLLQAHGMTATFFVNTGTIGDAEHLSWANLHTLYDAGNEIAGHTLDHVDLKPLTTAEARQQVCTDRNNLLAEGFPATSFAYPFGSFDSGTEAVVHDCGYNSGRGVSGISKMGPYAETIPPLDPYATRTPPTPRRPPSSPPLSCTCRTPRPTAVAGSSSSSTISASNATPTPSPRASSPRCWTSCKARLPLPG
jgi:peptidoglycan/xylan/chitin deacetylase (PgdA/CDA1 family)